MFHWTLMLSGHSSTFLLSCFTGLLCYQVIAAHIPLVMFQWTLMLSGHNSSSSCHVSLDSYVIRSQQHIFLLSCFTGLLCYQVIAAHIPLVMFQWTLMLSGHSSAFLLSCFTGLLCYKVITAAPLVMFHWTLMLSGHNSSSSCHVSMDSYVIRSQLHTFLLSCFNGLLCYQVITAAPLIMFQWTLMLSGHSSTLLLSCFNGLLCYQVITAAPLVMFHWTLMLSGHSSTYSSCHVSLDSYVIRSQLHTFLLSCFNGLLCYQVITAAPLVMFQWTLIL